MKKIFVEFICLFTFIMVTGCATVSTTSNNNSSKKSPKEKIVPIPEMNLEAEVESIVIDAKSQMLQSKQLIAGKTYKITVGPFKSEYVIFQNYNQSIDRCTWNPVENDGTGYFTSVEEIPLDSTVLRIATSSSKNNFQNITYQFDVVPRPEGIRYIYPTEEPYSIVQVDARMMNIKTEKLEKGNFYKFAIKPKAEKYAIICISCGNKKDNSWNVLELEQGKVNYSRAIQIPEDAERVYIAYTDDKNNYKSHYLEFMIDEAPVKVKTMVSASNEFYKVLNVERGCINGFEEIEGGQFYQVNIPYYDANYLVLSCENKNKENVFYSMIKNDGTNSLSKLCRIPQNAVDFTIWKLESEKNYNGKIVKFDVKNSKAPYKFVSDKNTLEFTRKYKTDKPDPMLLDYLKEQKLDEKIKKDTDTVIDEVIGKIGAMTEDEFYKVKLIHDAIWYFVSYDMDDYYKGTIPPQNYEYVLKTGGAVCQGFSNVFTEFCRRAGIIELPVSGYARGLNWKPGDDVTKSNHAWNVVKINDYWYVIDCTWDSGKTEKGKRYDTYGCNYLFSDPYDFLHTHLPLDSSLQLLEQQLTADEFRNLEFSIPRK